MRRIKFRVWDSDFKRWLFYGPGYDLGGFGGIQFRETGLEKEWAKGTNAIVHNIEPSSPEDWLNYNKERFTVQQFTGLNGKDGKEIYEGDIVKCRFSGRQDKENVGVIEFCEKYGHFGIRITTSKIHVNAIHIPKPFSNFMTNDSKLLVKVIGNLFETPDLLK